MKLLSKYNRVNAVATIVILLISAVIYYFFIEGALVHQLDKSLVVEENEINGYITENNQLPETSVSKDEQELYAPASAFIKRNFSSIELYNSHHKIYYRQLEFPVTVKGKMYTAVVRKSQEETEGLVQLILKITLAVVIILLLTLFLINRFILNKLWKPFNNTLQQIKEFKIAGQPDLQLDETNITEFTELNTAVSFMTKKATHDYNEIKNFTENASHEIQTPLAIIKSKVELLSQSENIREDQMNNIQAIAETTNRLSKLNQSLLLLTKIDNRQFNETEEINITGLLHQHLNNYEELLQAKKIQLFKKITPSTMIVMNETLAGILITNILSNAIRHNVDNGHILIELSNKSLVVTNTGALLQVNPEVFFQRFRKESSSGESLGLGLSIVKKISDTYGFATAYTYVKQLHTITVTF